MKKYRTANGKLIDIDGLRLANEDTIAVGNMRTNARGDELGPGGRVVKTRNEKMNENYKLHTMVPKDDAVHADAITAQITTDERSARMEQVRDIVRRTEEAKKQEPVETKETDADDLEDITKFYSEPAPAAPAHAGPQFGNLNDLSKEQTPVVSKRRRGSLAAEVAKTSEVQQNTSSVPVKTIRRI